MITAFLNFVGFQDALVPKTCVHGAKFLSSCIGMRMAKVLILALCRFSRRTCAQNIISWAEISFTLSTQYILVYVQSACEYQALIITTTLQFVGFQDALVLKKKYFHSLWSLLWPRKITFFWRLIITPSWVASIYSMNFTQTSHQILWHRKTEAIGIGIAVLIYHILAFFQFSRRTFVQKSLHESGIHHCPPNNTSWNLNGNVNNPPHSRDLLVSRCTCPQNMLSRKLGVLFFYWFPT